MRANMTDLELDRAVEQAAAKEWEEQNAQADGKRLRMAANSMRYAVDHLDKTLDLISDAAEALADTPEGDRVASYVDEIENVLTDLKKMQKDFDWRGNI